MSRIRIVRAEMEPPEDEDVLVVLGDMGAEPPTEILQEEGVLLHLNRAEASLLLGQLAAALGMELR